MSDNFIIIGSDGWGDRQDVVEGVEAQAVGSISVRIKSHYLNSFDDKYLNLNPFTHVENPWFREFWEDKFHCSLQPTEMPTTQATTEAFEYDNETLALPVLQQQPHPIPMCTGKYYRNN